MPRLPSGPGCVATAPAWIDVRLGGSSAAVSKVAFPAWMSTPLPSTAYAQAM
jgi:hypothetical protein